MAFCSDITDFYRVALGFPPIPYQKKIAEENWPDILEIPTGLGKTASVVLAWIFKRLRDEPGTPRRLVYVLPMRTLVEQTSTEVVKWIGSLEEGGLLQQGRIGVYKLMGGEVDRDWDYFPEKEAILVGTQDQLLSRALNRGYGMSRFRWPVHFALLNNDCLWVMDEVQLMGAGLATTAQMDVFRGSAGTFFPCRSLWMSATFDRKWLDTVDYKNARKNLTSLSLSEQDMAVEIVSRRVHARKILRKCPIDAEDEKKIAAFILENHSPHSRTLVVLNRVRRAQKVYRQIQKQIAESKTKKNPDLCLLHSRYRPGDRQKMLETLLASPGEEGTICIATQVVEAGVDVSCALLVTDLAPWSSLVQRFGRTNRYGEYDNSQIFWLDPGEKKKGWASPYEEDSLRSARKILSQHEGGNAAPADLPEFSEPLKEGSVLRRKDLYELFDTTSDLSGFDVDVTRFIRDSEGLGVLVFWRDFPDGNPPVANSSPSQEELCPAPLEDIIDRIKKKKPVYQWDHLEKEWKKVLSVFPGSVVLLPLPDGGYDSEIGWTGQTTDLPPPIRTAEKAAPEGDDDEPLTEENSEKTLAEHTDEVLAEIKRILDALDGEKKFLPEEIRVSLVKSGRWHDAGKAHPVFRRFLAGADGTLSDIVLAKGKKASNAFERKGFRHELASALAYLQTFRGRGGDPAALALSAYIIAAHHGKVRLSIRSMPHEKHPPEVGVRFARGIWEGDILPSADLGGGERLEETLLNLSPMELGTGESGRSWTGEILSLLYRQDFGPFRLAFLEALLRIADWNASQKGGIR